MPTIAFGGRSCNGRCIALSGGCLRPRNDSQSVWVGLCVDVHCDVSGIPVEVGQSNKAPDQPCSGDATRPAEAGPTSPLTLLTG